MVSLQSEEAEPKGENTEILSSSPPRVICTHCHHLADYIKLFMEKGEELTLGEDRAAPLITEVPPYSKCSDLQFVLSSLLIF